MTVLTATFIIIFFILSMLSALVLKSMVNILVSELINSFLPLRSSNVSSNSVCRLFVKFSMTFTGPSVASPSLHLIHAQFHETVKLGRYLGCCFFVKSSNSMSKRQVCNIFKILIWFFTFFSVFFAF